MNENERYAHDGLLRAGYRVLRNGWPDFLVVKDEEQIFAIEWKEFGDKVRPDQEAMHTVLERAGIATLVTGSLDEALRFRPPSAYEVQLAQEVVVRDKVRSQRWKAERDCELMREELAHLTAEYRSLLKERDAVKRDISRAWRLRLSLAGLRKAS